MSRFGYSGWFEYVNCNSTHCDCQVGDITESLIISSKSRNGSHFRGPGRTGEVLTGVSNVGLNPLRGRCILYRDALNNLAVDLSSF